MLRWLKTLLLRLLLCCRYQSMQHGITECLSALQYAAEAFMCSSHLQRLLAGERLLAVLVSETRDDGSNSLHKFVFAPAGELPACMSPLQLTQRLSHRHR
jgi:hypothetical protein